MLKWWQILESLEFSVIGDAGCDRENERVRANIAKLQKSISLLPKDAVKYLIDILDVDCCVSSFEEILNEADSNDMYTIYTMVVLHKACNTDLKNNADEKLISEKQKSILAGCIKDIAEYGMKPNLHSAFYVRKGSIFSQTSGKKFNYYRLKLVVDVFSLMIYTNFFSWVRKSEEIILYYMGAIYSLLMSSDTNQHHLEETDISDLRSKLQRIWTEISRNIYYRNLMLLYGTLPPEQRRRIHGEMLRKLWSEGGYTALLFAMQKSERNDQPVAEEVVVKLVADPLYSKKAQQSLVKQVLRFLVTSVSNKDIMPLMGIGLVSLRKLYDNNNENKKLVKNWLMQQIKPLTEYIDDRLTVMEWEDFCIMISLLFQLFCTSSFDCLPSSLLVCFTPVLLSCYQQIRSHGNQETVCGQLSHLILRILNNREKEELYTIIKYIARNCFPADWLQKHPNVVIEENILSANNLRIVQKESDSDIDALKIHSLSKILMESSFHTLSYQVFIILFRLIPSLNIEKITDLKNSNIDILMSEEDIRNKMLNEFSIAYNEKFMIIDVCNALIQHKPLKHFINENIKDILITLKEILTRYTLYYNETLNEFDESVIMILIILIREILRSDHVILDEGKVMLLEGLKQFEGKVRDKHLKYQILSLRSQMEDKPNFCGDPLQSSSERFEDARSLIESDKPYRQVEGIEKLVKLIKEKDEFTLSSSHIVIALAMSTLKSSESYTFLNCVRLFVSLVNINESQVLEILADVYLNESANMDYRLVVGEALLKVCKELGPLCYNYKALLLNTYMYGCRSNLDEFRLSSYSNLAQMCKLLTFEVQNFFEELLHLINCELTNGKYVPAKRAAVMVLSDILAGITNLFDYEEMLLPIYRLLKLLAASDSCDEQMRLHATVGLDIISEKCKELLSTVNQQPLEKHIKVIGIGNSSKSNSLKSSILYINE